MQDDLTGGYVLAALWLGVASKTWRGGEAGGCAPPLLPLAPLLPPS